MRKLLLIVLALFLTGAIEAQDNRIYATYGNPTKEELNMTSYPPDSTAAAVVLYENGTYKFELIESQMILSKTVHRKIKVLDATRFKGDQIQIELYKGEKKEDNEKIIWLRGYTYNGIDKDILQTRNIYYVDLDEKFAAARFAFPNVRDGSVLEYKYRLETKYFFNFGEWKFQGEYPKIYSEFISEIPFNFNFNRILQGDQKLDVNFAYDQPSCIQLNSYYYTDSDCEYSVYGMKNVPSYSEEPYALSVDNYISKIRHELSEYKYLDGGTKKFAQSWEDVDREFRKEKSVGKQLKNQGFFKSQLPESILSIDNDITRAKAVYEFIRDHYNWNGEYRIFQGVDVKASFKAGKGNNSEINLALVNALNAAGIETLPAFISTRPNGLPTLAYPVFTQFNFILAYAIVDDEKVFMDATDKLTPYGYLPFRDLNIYARVMDFDKGSYWETINPNQENSHVYRANMSVAADGSMNGESNWTLKGYPAWQFRQYLVDSQPEDYVDVLNLESGLSTVEDLEVNNVNNAEAPLQINFEIYSEGGPEDEILLYPLKVQPLFKENPFKLEKREYPVDFGFPESFTALIQFKVDPAFGIKSTPEDVQLILDQNKGLFSVNYNLKDNILLVRLQYRRNAFQFPTNKTSELRDFFGSIAQLQNKTLVVLKRK